MLLVIFHTSSYVGANIPQRMHNSPVELVFHTPVSAKNKMELFGT